MTTCFCPHCGFDLRNDEPITVGRVTYDPRGELIVAGFAVHMTPRERIFVGTLLAARGRLVPRSTLADRIGCDGERPDLEVSTVAKLCRRTLERAGLPGAIRTEYKAGYAWAAQ